MLIILYYTLINKVLAMLIILKHLSDYCLFQPSSENRLEMFDGANIQHENAFVKSFC